MKKEMMKILCCPNCKSSLTLTTNTCEKEEIISGKLHCSQCKKTYPIVQGIPNFIDDTD